MNKYIVIIYILIITLLGLTLGIKFYNYFKSIENKEIYIVPSVSVKRTDKMGRGVFAEKDYNKGEIIEICPIVLSKKTCGTMKDYIFSYDDNYSATALGYCAVYNHSDKNNAKFNVLDENRMAIKCIKDINKGEEIFISYGKKYWTSRKNKEKY